MKSSLKVVGVAVVAALLGAGAGLWLNGPGPLWRSEPGQLALQAVADATAPQPPPDLKIAQRGQIVPTFRLPDLQGRQVEIPTAHTGRPLLINVWASWCGPCIQEMPALDRYARAQGATGTQVVGIALDDPAAVDAFLRQVPIGYPVLVDTPSAHDAGVRLGNLKGVLPYSVLLDANGRLLKQKIGPFAEGEIEAWAR